VTRKGKLLAISLAVVLGTPVVARLAIEIWASYRLSAFEMFWTKGIGAERARAATRPSPVLAGAPIDQNAAPRYRELLPRAGEIEKKELESVLSSPPRAPFPEDLKALLDAHRQDLAQLREIVRCSRCDWELRYEKEGALAELPDLRKGFNLATLLVLEGHERASVGDTDGAADRYLESARIGIDFARGPTIAYLTGGLMIRQALLSLGRLLVETPREALEHLDTIEARLKQLEPAIPSAADAFRVERLAKPGVLRAKLAERLENAPSGTGSGIASRLVSNRVLLALALIEIDGRFAVAEGAASARTLSERRELLSFLRGRESPEGDPLFDEKAPAGYVESVSRRGDEQLAWLRVVLAAVLLEKHRARNGSYPKDASGIALPEDPHARPALLRYEALGEGTGYRVWSVGLNEVDDGSRGDDLVLERRSPDSGK